AEGFVRYRGESVVALVGDKATIDSITDLDVPIMWQPQRPIESMEEATATGALLLHADKPENVLIRGHARKGDVEAAMGAAAATAEGRWETAFVEHAYIEPEAGFAVRVGDRIEVTACTQAPYMDRDEVSSTMGLAKEQVRIIPTACGGGFGGKLDVSLQPVVA